MSFCGTTDLDCFGLVMTSTLCFKARVDFSLARFLACMLFLRFTSGATAAKLLTVMILDS